MEIPKKTEAQDMGRVSIPVNLQSWQHGFFCALKAYSSWAKLVVGRVVLNLGLEAWNVVLWVECGQKIRFMQKPIFFPLISPFALSICSERVNVPLHMGALWLNIKLLKSWRPVKGSQEAYCGVTNFRWTRVTL